MNDAQIVADVKRQLSTQVARNRRRLRYAERAFYEFEDWCAAHSRWEASEAARDAARPCKTVAELLACDNPDVRLAAQMALGINPPNLP